MKTPTAGLWGLLTLLSGAVAQNQGNQPFWIVSHAPLLTTRIDPLVTPGGISGHVHAIIGGSAFSPVYEYDKLIQSKCTTANIDIDFSNYWVPQLFRKSSNGTLTIAPLSYANTYYQTRRTGQEKVYEFPPGFRMLAGDASRTTLDLSNPTNDAIRYVCLGKSIPEGHEFPKENCPHGLRAQAYFPHCWDGVNAWLEGSKHVSYGEGRFDGGGKCPSTHPYRIQGLFYEFIFKDDYTYEPGARVWANGDTVGYTLHADFANGWPVGFFKEIFDQGKTCDVGFSLDKCPPLAKHMSKAGGSCAPEGVRVDEDIGLNGLAKLPGNNPIFSTSLPAKDANHVETAKFVPVTPSLPTSWDLRGCIAEVSGRALRGASLTSDDSLTPAKCMKFCADKGFSMAGVEYGKECYCGNDLSSGASESTPAENPCDMACPGMAYSKGMCGGRSAISFYRWTGNGAPAVVEGEVESIEPKPIRIAQVKATERRANHALGDPEYPAGNMVETLPGGEVPPTIEAPTTSTTSTAGGTSSTSPGHVLIPIPSSPTSTSAMPTKTPGEGGACRRSRKRSIFVAEEVCVETEEGKIVCGLQV